MSSRRPPSSDDHGDFGEEDPTIIEDPSVREFDTPPTMPRCHVCKRVVFFDDWTPGASIVAEGLFNGDRCVRSRPDVERWWYWCGERRTVTFYVPP